MFTRLRVAVLVALATAPALLPSAHAQAVSQEEVCASAGDILANNEAAAAACTSLIDSGKLRGDDLAAAVYFRGSAYSSLGKADQALADLGEAIRLAPGSAQARATRGALLLDLEKHDQAIADFDEALRLAPDDAYAFSLRGEAYHGKKEYARAVQDYDQALRLEPDDAFVLASRCAARAHWGQQLEAALDDCSQSLRLEPQEQYALEQRGLVQLRLGRHQDAIADYSAALAGYAGRVESLYGRGIAKLRSGDASGGQADIAQAIRIDADVSALFAGWGVKP